MILYKKWDIVLVPFPFTDLSTTKKRPSLIISPDEFNKNDDLIIAFITSKIPDQLRFGDFRIKEWENSGLPKPFLIRMKFSTISKTINKTISKTISKTILVKQIGRLLDIECKSFQYELIEFFKK